MSIGSIPLFPRVRRPAEARSAEWGCRRAAFVSFSSVRNAVGCLVPRLKVVAILFAWFLTTGSQWDFVQTLGWGRMIVRYSETMSVAQAIKRTLGGEMCGVCAAVSHAKQQGQTSNVAAENAPAKAVMVCPLAPQFVLIAPERGSWPPGAFVMRSEARRAPLRPPPRV
jgi:hypothetical protein